MNISFLSNIPTSQDKPGAFVHITQVANNLLKNGHTLYTNLLDETDRFVKLREDDFFRRGDVIDAFYIRIDGSPPKDRLTRYRLANPSAPCIWEINAPLEELMAHGASETIIQQENEKRKNLAKVVDAAVCVSQEMAEYAKNFLGIKQTYVVPNGSDPVMFSPEKRENGHYGNSSFTVLWSGSPEYSWQGLDLAEKIAERLKHEDSEITVAVTAKGDSNDNLIYLGKVPYNEMPKYMASADVGLCIYEHIDFFDKFFFSPLKLYDYMASGLPVIGSNAGQIKQVVEECRCGVLTDTTIDDLVNKILYFKNNRSEAKELGNKGRKAVIEKYNWENVTRRLEEILLEQIENKKHFPFPIAGDKTEWLNKLSEHELRETALVLAKKNRQFSEMITLQNQLLNDKDDQLNNKIKRLIEREGYIDALLSSTSWKITEPLRKIVEMFRR